MKIVRLLSLLALTLAAPLLGAEFAYVANFGSNNVSAYTINATTGALTPVSGSPFAAGAFPNSVTVDPAGKFVFVANGNSKNISAYTINAATGALTPVSGSPFAAGNDPVSITVDPTGEFAYVANQNGNNVSAYTINAATGALTPMAGSPFAAGTTPASVTVDPTGKLAYVANEISGNVSAYTINTATGALTSVPGSPFGAGSDPRSVTVDPTGKFAYIANEVSGNVSAYTIDAATGALTPVPGSPFAAGLGPFSVTVDPTGKFAYVANEVGGKVSAYTINAATGALTPLPGSPFAAGSAPFSVTVDPTGKFAYVANFSDSNISAYTINAATGALTPVPGSPFAAGSLPVSIVTTAGPAVPIAPPTVAKAFGAAAIPLNGVTTLSFTITNGNATLLTGVGFTDTLPVGLAVASPNGATACSGTLPTTTAGSITLAGATLAASEMCTFSVNVMGTVAGPYSNVTGTITSTESGAGVASNVALLTVVAPPTISKAFGAPGIDINGITTLTFSLTNSNAVALTGVGFSDFLPPGLAVASPSGATACNGTLPATTAGSIRLTGVTLVANGSCAFSVNVTGTAAGPQTNTTSNVSSDNGGAGPAATAAINVLPVILGQGEYQLRYFANQFGATRASGILPDSFINATNAGTVSGLDPNGRICANFYLFDPREEIVSCCACLITPNGLVSLSASSDLINTLTGAPLNSGITVKVLASLPTPVGGTVCNPSAPTQGTLARGLKLWAVTPHVNTGPTPAFQLTETEFTRSELALDELSKLTGLCRFIQTAGSGFGQCRSCPTVGAQGADIR